MNLEEDIDKSKEQLRNEVIFCTRIAFIHSNSKDLIKAFKLTIKEKEERLVREIKQKK